MFWEGIDFQDDRSCRHKNGFIVFTTERICKPKKVLCASKQLGDIFRYKAPMKLYKVCIEKYLPAILIFFGFIGKFLVSVVLDLPRMRVKILAAFSRHRFVAQKNVPREGGEKNFDREIESPSIYSVNTRKQLKFYRTAMKNISLRTQSRGLRRSIISVTCCCSLCRHPEGRRWYCSSSLPASPIACRS